MTERVAAPQIGEGSPANDDMEVSGLSLSVMREGYTIGTSFKRRIVLAKTAAARYTSAGELVGRRMTISEASEKKFELFPVETAPMFFEDIASARGNLLDLEKRLKDCCPNARGRLHGFFRANSLADRVEAIEREAKDEENKLRSLLMQLTVVAKAPVPRKVGMPPDFYCPKTNVFQLLHNTGYYNGGGIASIINSLKSELINGGARRTSLWGTAGFGKTTILHRLAHDRDIRKCFPDGVLLITCGARGDARAVLPELGEIVRKTGGMSRASIIESSSSLLYAISVAADWFKNRRCLFLLKDVSRFEDDESEDLAMLRDKFCAGSESQMVIGSRSRVVAANCEHAVSITPTETDLVGVFLARSLRNDHPELNPKTIESGRSVVSECEGMFFAAALAGNGVRCQTRRAVDFGTACWKYRDDLRQQRDASESVIDATLTINLRYLEGDGDFKNIVETCGMKESMKSLYSSLFIFKSRQIVFFSKLARLWEVEVDIARRVVGLWDCGGLVKMAQKDDDSNMPIAGFFIYEAYTKFCCRLAEENGGKERWLMRGREL